MRLTAITERLAGLGGDGEFPDQFGKDLCPLGILAALAVHDVLEF